MRGDRLSVIEPLELLSVIRFGSRLWLAVCDTSRRRHFITLGFTTTADAQSYVRPMRDWIARRAPLAYVRRRGEGALIDIDALLARAIA
jgi:hypothetical protein